MAHSADDRPSGSPLPGPQADGSASPVDEAAAWLEQTGAGAGKPRRRPAAPPPEDPVLLGPDADAEEVARKILLDQLTGQARSRAELATKLAKRRVPEDVAERLLDRFEEVGLIDDAAFARLWVESRQPGKGLGRRALAQELRRKGIDDEVAKSALAEVEPEDEEAAARELVRRKLRSMRNLDRVTATRRLTGMLARKGHSGDIVWRVVREELDSGGLDEPEDRSDLHGDVWSP
jgi:regulatory protein